MPVKNVDDYYSNLEINLEKIEKRIQVFQQRIFKASKNCATQTIHKHQNDFLVHKDFYLVFVQKIILVLKRNIQCNYTYYKKLSALIYFTLYEHNQTSYRGLQLIKNRITQYVLFLLLKPEWEARYESFVYIHHKHQYIKIVKKHITKLFCIYSSYKSTYSLKIKTQINYKDVSSQRVVQKLNNSQYISSILNTWLNQQNFINQNVLTRYLTQSIKYESNFYSLLDTIMYIGIEWYLYVNLKIKSIYLKIFINKQPNYLFLVSVSLITNMVLENIASFLDLVGMNLRSVKCIIYKYINHFVFLDNISIITKDKDNLVVKVSQQSIKSVYRLIKYKLYHKNKLGYWRANNFLTSTQAVFFVRAILSDWYKYYNDIVYTKELTFVNNKIDKIFYTWQMKK